MPAILQLPITPSKQQIPKAATRALRQPVGRFWNERERVLCQIADNGRNSIQLERYKHGSQRTNPEHHRQDTKYPNHQPRGGEDNNLSDYTCGYKKKGRDNIQLQPIQKQEHQSPKLDMQYMQKRRRALKKNSSGGQCVRSHSGLQLQNEGRHNIRQGQDQEGPGSGSEEHRRWQAQLHQAEQQHWAEESLKPKPTPGKTKKRTYEMLWFRGVVVGRK